MKNSIEKAFDNYIKNYDMNVKEINYKYYHSYKVKELMRVLATMLNFSKEDIELAEAIGLLHDIGRFEQIKKYGVCADELTGTDHADESCIYLFDEGHIKDYYDKEEHYQIMYDAIKNHNKLKIDSSLKDKNLLFAKLIRDADKIDIYRVLYENYTYTYNKDEISKEVLEVYNQEKTIDNHLKRTKTDLVYKFLAFIYDIYFKESFVVLKNTKNLDKLFSVINPVECSEEELNNLKKQVFDYIEKRINE